VSDSLTALLEGLSAGERPRAVELALLSGLDRPAVERVREAWPAFPEATRDDLLQRATELAEDNVDLDFAAVARVALDDPSPAVRRRAIATLWEARDRATAGALVRLLSGDTDESVRAAAASALGPFVLLRELGQCDAESGDAAVEALRARAGDPAESVDVRARAVESLGPRTLEWVDTLIADAYYDDDPRLRLAGVRAMGASAQERWLEYLEEQAQSDDPEVRYEAAAAVGAIGSEDGVAIVADLLEDEDAEVVAAALGALGEIGGDEAIEHLEGFLEDGHDDLRELARAALEAANFLGDSDLMRRGLLDAQE
jgi:HEAT repeat protein